MTKRKRVNSRQKGKRSELDCVKQCFHEHGFSARRGQQYAGGTDSADVVPTVLMDGHHPAIMSEYEQHWDKVIHPEVKNQQQWKPYEWMDQAEKDASGLQTPVVFAKRNGKPWMVMMPADSFMPWLKDYMDLARRCGRRFGETGYKVVDDD